MSHAGSSASQDTGYWRDVSHNKGHLFVDKEGLPRYDGAPEYLDQFEERCRGCHFALREDDRKLLPNRIKNQLTGRAYLLTAKVKEISAEELYNQQDANDPLKALKHLLAHIRAAVQDIQQIQVTEAFDNFFDTNRGNRRWGEPIPEYAARRTEEFEQLKKTSPGTTISDDLYCYFFLKKVGLSQKEVMTILTMTGNKYDQDKVMSSILLQHHRLHERESSGDRPRLTRNNLRKFTPKV